MLGTIIDNKYRVLSLLGEGASSFVYRVENLTGRNNLALKILKKGFSSSYIEDAIRFQREVKYISGFNHDRIVKVYSAGEYEASPYFVMDLLEGKSLEEILQTGVKFNFADITVFIKQVLEGLVYVHSKGIIHRDLKPGNIIIQEDAAGNVAGVKLVDFGLAEVIELKQFRQQQDIRGTFSYMSPEASGTINRPVDERSDLYSLGIICYELLTEMPPFQGETISALLHQQIAKQPLSPKHIKPSCPHILSEITLKLIAKDPEDRYQTAKGLLSDIVKYENGQENFILGKDDRLVKLTYRSRLIGREREQERLKEYFQRAGDGQGNICFICGEAGRGKSRLVEEMRSFIYDAGGIFLSGKCFEVGDNKLPYQPFKSLINEYIKHVESQAEKERVFEVTRIKDVLKDLGEVIIRLNTNMEILLGKQPALIPLEPERENKRFLIVSSRFFCSLGIPGRPCVLFLDDLQWADEGSLVLLQQISREISAYPVLLIVALRDNEIGPAHTLNRIRDEAKENKYPLEIINLDLFGKDALTRLTAELLSQEEDTEEVSSYVLEKSKGNTFFAIEIIRQLVEEGGLIFKDGHWAINHQKIGTISVSESLIDTILRRIKDIGPQLSEVLSYASVIGKEFDTELLFSLLSIPKETMVEYIDEAVKLQLLERSLDKRRMLFVHDRVKDAFYQRLGPDGRRQIHLQIAKTIESLYQGRIEEAVFDLAYHYIEAKDKEKSLYYSLPAAQKASNTYANEEAIRYFRLYIELLEEKGEKDSIDLVRAREALIPLYLKAGSNDQAIETANQVLPFKKSPSEKAGIFRHIGSAFFKKGDWINCENSLVKGLSLLGESVPLSKPEVRLSLLKEVLTHLMHCVFPSLFLGRRKVKDADKYAQIFFLYVPLSWGYILSDGEKFARSVLRVLNLAEAKIGPSPELASALSGYGSLCMALPLFPRALRYHQKALGLRRAFKDEWGRGQTLQFMGYCYEWEGDYQKSISIFKESGDLFQKIGDTWELAMVFNGLAFAHFWKGDYRNAWDYASRYFDIGKKTGDAYALTNSGELLARICLEQGELEKAESLARDALCLSEKKKLLYLVCVININLGMLEMSRLRWAEAIKYLEAARQLFEANLFLKNYTVYLYAYLADAYLEELKANPLIGRERVVRLKKIRSICNVALRYSKKWVNHYTSSLRIMAKYYSYLGREKSGMRYRQQAERYFLKSIEYAKKIGRLSELAKAGYEYGIFLKDNGRLDESKKYLDAGSTKTSETGRERLRYDMELNSVLKTSQYLSSILNIEELLKKILASAIELVGAERGFLMLYPQEEDMPRNLEVVVRKNIESISDESLEVSMSIIKEVERTKKARIVIDAGRDEALKTKMSVVRYGLRSILCVPITVKEEFLGVIYIDNRLVGGLFDEHHLQILNLLSAQAGISIQNARLYNRAVIDGLTRIYNRSFLEHSLMRAVKEAARYNTALSVLMLDIDHFKSFNDNYGHHTGDEILRSIAHILQDSVRASDIVARYGGEEFTVVLPKADIKLAKEVAQRLRRDVEQCVIKNQQGGELKVTVSIGVTEFKAGEEVISLVERADKALYQAKQNGRNRVEAI